MADQGPDIEKLSDEEVRWRMLANPPAIGRLGDVEEAGRRDPGTLSGRIAQQKSRRYIRAQVRETEERHGTQAPDFGESQRPQKATPSTSSPPKEGLLQRVTRKQP